VKLKVGTGIFTQFLRPGLAVGETSPKVWKMSRTEILSSKYYINLAGGSKVP